MGRKDKERKNEGEVVLSIRLDFELDYGVSNVLITLSVPDM